MYYLNTGKDAAHTMLTTKCMYMLLSLFGGEYLSTWRVIKSAELLTYMYCAINNLKNWTGHTYMIWHTMLLS